MSIEEILEFWETLKPFIAASDRSNAAESFVSFLDAHGYADELENAIDLPEELYNASIACFGESADDDDEYSYA